MKNLLYTIVILMTSCFGVMAQSPTENYIKTTTYTAPSTGAITENDTIVSVAYFDGLGRPKQTVAVRAGGQGQDIVTPVVYDNFGRQTKEYLPYATVTQNGNIHVDPMTEVEAFYNARFGSVPNPYSEKLLENSPLNRIIKQGAPGADWMADPASDTDHSIKFEYDTNAAGEVRLFKANLTFTPYGVNSATYVPTLDNPDPYFYNTATLYKTIIKDENWQPGDGNLHTTEEFKDKRGRIVLKRTYADMPGEPGASHDTYYVYDKFSNLTYVIPPKVTTDDGVSTEELNELCYQYVYDHRNRLVEKKLPGKGWEAIVYNKLDQPVFTQDPNLAANNQWLFTKYDKFSRAIYTGIFSSSDSRVAMQTTMEGLTHLYEAKTGSPTGIDGTQVYYDNSVFPTTNIEVLTINYYDNYTFDLDGGVVEDAYGVSPITQATGLSTGNKTRVLETDQWITTVTYYDKKARPVYTYTRNAYLNTTDKIKHQLDFTGKILESTAAHTKDGLADITSIDKFTYDAMGRLLTQIHQVAGHPEEIIAQQTYDALGHFIQKKVGNTIAIPLQTIDYSYNIRGWLIGINDVNNIGNDLFSFNIRYTNPELGSTPLYNGNISQTLWRTNNVDASLKEYSYSYDALNRITGAMDNTGNYNLNSISYDKNGNILSLNRQGHINEVANLFGVMDDLVYTYDIGNKLLKVEDTANDTYGFKDDAVAADDNTNDYSYDDNGNMINDTNKGITAISYNYLNLPTHITINGENILYIYNAAGIKQQKIADGTITDYAGNYIYENGSLKFISHLEGYIEPDGAGGYSYVYQYKDFWKNVRLTYADDNGDGIVDNSEIRREQNYYPFGLEHKGYNGQMYGTKNNLKTFQGQEFHDELGLDITEFKYRFYDPSVGRFWSIDPLAEDFVYNSTYAFAENKLGMGIELEGLENYYNDLTSMVIMKGAELINKFTGGSKNAYEASTGDVIRNRLSASNPEFDAERARMERVEKLSNGLGNVAESSSDAGHFGLDVLGASDIPVLSQLADGGNALWYLSEGNYVDASLSGFAVLPVIGNAALGAKWGKNALKFADNGFVSKAGLFFGIGGKEGNRLSHVMAHFSDDLSKSFQGVFTIGADELVGTLDEAWDIIKSSDMEGTLRGGNRAFDVDLGRIIGKEGGSLGDGSNLTKIRVVVENGTSNVISAYPIK